MLLKKKKVEGSLQCTNAQCLPSPSAAVMRFRSGENSRALRRVLCHPLTLLYSSLDSNREKGVSFPCSSPCIAHWCHPITIYTCVLQCWTIEKIKNLPPTPFVSLVCRFLTLVMTFHTLQWKGQSQDRSVSKHDGELSVLCLCASEYKWAFQRGFWCIKGTEKCMFCTTQVESKWGWFKHIYWKDGCQRFVCSIVVIFSEVILALYSIL